MRPNVEMTVKPDVPKPFRLRHMFFSPTGISWHRLSSRATSFLCDEKCSFRGDSFRGLISFVTHTSRLKIYFGGRVVVNIGRVDVFTFSPIDFYHCPLSSLLREGPTSIKKIDRLRR